MTGGFNTFLCRNDAIERRQGLMTLPKTEKAAKGKEGDSQLQQLQQLAQLPQLRQLQLLSTVWFPENLFFINRFYAQRWEYVP
jgi:hypothetical protein